VAGRGPLRTVRLRTGARVPFLPPSITRNANTEALTAHLPRRARPGR
jgi:hypothetical protein